MVVSKCIGCGKTMELKEGPLGYATPKKYCETCKPFADTILSKRRDYRNSIINSTKVIKFRIEKIKELKIKLGQLSDPGIALRYYLINQRYPWQKEQTIEEKQAKELKQKKQDEEKQ